MENRSLEIFCPCCGAVLTVDAATGAVLSHDAPKRPHHSLEEAASEVQKGRRRAESLFERAMDESAHQSEILEKKFQKAFEKAADDDSVPQSPFDLD
ncbi:MAG TPA: hypothetical protein VNI57_05760 [Candidatus Saccharimonadales bacterium]|nr:hypothetical protein [Candidatus Saccharimonadales bacterium]